MTNFKEMMNPIELTKHNTQIMNGFMDKVWEVYDAQREGINQFNQKMYDMMEQTISAAKTQSETITSKMDLNNDKPFKLIDQMVDHTKATQESIMNLSDQCMRQIKKNMYKTIENPTGVFDSMSNTLSSNPAVKSCMDLAKRVEGFSKMPWMNLGGDVFSASADSADKATAADASVVKKKAI
ncbi:MAG: hypothetical protein CVU90_12415 [Firmicutes bacterium HGW-Firmicutes-15]|nr:MAG: hypothetical protein CVU90_12415 [Firmicutes bacterium HGW-Firmicutes-15]